MAGMETASALTRAAFPDAEMVEITPTADSGELVGVYGDGERVNGAMVYRTLWRAADDPEANGFPAVDDVAALVVAAMAAKEATYEPVPARGYAAWWVTL